MSGTFTDGKSNQRVERVHGKWIVIEYDEDASFGFNGAAASIRKTQDENQSKIIIPEGVAEKQHDINELERVYKVTHVGPDSESPVEVGDYVVAKGNVFRLFTEPTMYAALAENIVATVRIND